MTMLLLRPPALMVLYHVTRKDRVAKIRRQGLKPHVPGKVWGVCDPAATRGTPVVWLTANPLDWKHDRHPNKAFRDPNAVMLTILIGWQTRLHHYLTWLDPHKKSDWVSQNNLLPWFVYFGTIKPAQIIDGLERPKRKPRR
jgi:hypothetical protein